MLNLNSRRLFLSVFVLTGAVAGCSASPNGEGSGANGDGDGDGSPSTGDGDGDGDGDIGDIVVEGTGGRSTDVANGECDQFNFVSSRKPVSMLLVLDRSKSMIENNTLDGITRWEAIVPAVTAAIDATNETIHWGLKLYPESQETGACQPETLTSDIHVPITPQNATAVNGGINGTMALGDGTPTGHAIKAASEYLATLGDETQKYILLATDGVPSCDGTPSENSEGAQTYAVEQIAAAYGAGFPTFVIGVLGGSESTTRRLNEMAVAGGRAKSVNPVADKFHLAESKDALIDALNSITSQVGSCVFEFDEPPPVPDNIAVKIGGELVFEGPDGWRYTSDQHLGVELQGAACQQVRTANQAEIDIIFGCPGVAIK